jgi:alpha-L-arabinofuranosidase
MSDFIEETVAICDAVAATRKSRKRIHLSFDEWNVWFHSHGDREKMEAWQVAPPLLEDIYTMEDALVVGGMLISLLNHADRVKIGCIAQVVNVIAPIMTAKNGPAWRQTIFFPFQHASNFGRGRVLRAVVKSPLYDCKERDGTPVLTSACVENEEGGITIFAVNRSLDQTLNLKLDLRAFGKLTVKDHIVLHHDDLKAANTREAPETVVPQRAKGATGEGAPAAIPLQPASWNVIRLG